MNTEERKRVTLTHANLSIPKEKERGSRDQPEKSKSKEKGEPGQGERIKEPGLGAPPHEISVR